VIAVYLYTNREAIQARRADSEIASAEELLDKAKVLPDAPRLADELQAAAGKLAEAKTEKQKGRIQFAINAAVESQSIVKRVLEGKSTARGDATVLAVGGKVEVQRASRATWETAREGMQLYEGDFLKTGSSGAADVMAENGTMYRIKSDTLLEVHRSTTTNSATGEKHRRSGVKSIVGIIDINTGEGSSSVVETDAAEVRLGSKSSGSVDVNQSKSTGLAVYQGTGTLSNPTGGSVKLGEQERVVAELGGAISEKQKLPNAPKPLTPEDGATYDLRSKEPVRLKWAPVKEISRYRLQIAQSRLFIPDSIIADLLDRTKPEAEATLAVEGSYWWRVASLGRGSLTSEWSAARRFRISATSSGSGRDTVPPELVVSRPSVTGPIVMVQGKTEPGATVTVNGEPADSDSSGAFKKIISINKEGLATVEVKAVDGAGNETVRRESVVIQYY
jgi:hypothetical protein